MQNSPRLDLLSKQIRAAVPNSLSQTGEEALAAFLALPGVDAWIPGKLLLGELSEIFDIGLALALIGNNPSADRHKLEISRAVQQKETLPRSLWSEVQVGALLSKWGAEFSFIKRTTSPTPDIEVKLEGGLILDVEVACAEMRLAQTKAKDGLEALAGALRAGDVSWNIACYFADASKDTELREAFDAALTLRPGEFKQQSPRWAVRAIPLDQRDEVVGPKMAQLFGPDWWPSDAPNFLINSTIIGGPTSPVVCLRSLVPQVLYTNPIERKATSGQNRRGHPYLIALDVDKMPRAHGRIIDSLNDYFIKWDHVSGVLLFEQRFWIGVEDKKWIYSVHVNPHALLSLPPDLLGIANGKQHSLEFSLAG